MPETISHHDKCPDSGTCHHGCADGNCFRVGSCSPLSGTYPGDAWPDGLIFDANKHQAHLESQVEPAKKSDSMHASSKSKKVRSVFPLSVGGVFLIWYLLVGFWAGFTAGIIIFGALSAADVSLLKARETGLDADEEDLDRTFGFAIIVFLIFAILATCATAQVVSAYEAKAKIKNLQSVPVSAFDTPEKGVDALLVAAPETGQSTIGCVHIPDTVGSGWQPVAVKVNGRGEIQISGYIADSVTKAWSNITLPLQSACEKFNPAKQG